jgi:beta-lactamase regulating signal transducer with metallopeptidase domain
MSWLFDTLVWTGVLIALVLGARRAVSRQFGPKAAYALWLLPLARLAMPPIVLPAWLAPEASVPVAPADAYIAASTESGAQLSAANPAPAFDWMALVLAIWCAGAAIYIASRLLSYFELRRELLAGARPVGNAGPVRLLETNATASPLAFGVFDKVVALPPGFMASPDRRARDLALAHELSHHRAHDLAFNFVALPLFALHWFNPLSVLGWRAMRRDQEAACDARVVEHRDRVDRAAYAMLIASAVAGPRGALAAPMACPVLGDKSIVHRLRNLTMTTPSERRRRVGALLVGASLILVPLTASISYAQDGVPEAPEPPLPPAAPLPPEAPIPPEAVAAVRAPDAPLSPEAVADGARHERRVTVVRTVDSKGDSHAPRVITERRVIRTDKDGNFDEEAFEREMEALDRRLERLDDKLSDPEHIAPVARASARAGAMAARAAARAEARAPRLVMNCDGKGNVTETTASDGKRVIAICRQRIAMSAISGLRSARSQIAQDPQMPESARAEALRSIDREIERMEKDQ